MKPIFSCRQALGMALSGAASIVLALGMNAGAMALPDGYTGAIAHVSYSSIAVADAPFQCPAPVPGIL